MVHLIKLINVSNEDFPDPDGPTKATNSPSLIFILKLLNSVIDYPYGQNFFLNFISNKILFIS